MAVYLADYVTLVRDQLHDVSGGTEVWTDLEIKAHIHRAVKVFTYDGHARIMETILPVTTGSKEISLLAALDGRTRIDRVEFYVDQSTRKFRNWEEWGDYLTMDINFFPSATASTLTGTWTFTKDSTAVAANNDGDAEDEVAVGEYIHSSKDANGECYKVKTVTDDDNLVIDRAFTGATAADTEDATQLRTYDEVCRIYWAGQNYITTTASTIPEQYEQLIVDGACAYALGAYASEAREAIANAIAIIDTGNTAIDSVTAKVTAAAGQLAAGAPFIGYKLSEINTAITNAGAALARVVTDLASGRTAVGTELTNADNVLDGIGASLAVIEADIVAARSHMDVSGSEANTALDLMAALSAAGSTFLDAGDDFINTRNVGANVPALYAQYANAKYAESNAKYQEAMGFLAEDQPSREFLSAASVGVGATNAKIALARAYLAEDMVVGEYSGLAGGEVQLAANYLNQARLDMAQDAIAVEHRQYAAAELNNGAMLMRQGQAYYSECIHELRTADSVLKHSLAVADRREIVFKDGLKRAQGRQKRTRKNDLLPITP